MKTDYNNPPIGCYFDGAAGQTYNDIRVLKMALSFGFEDGDATDLVEKYDDNESDRIWDEDDSELLSYTLQEAEDYLNSLETRPFLYWHSNDGDFGLYADLEGAKEDCEFMSYAGRIGQRGQRGQDYPDDDYEGEWLHINDHGNCTLYVRENGEDREIWSLV